MYENLMETVVAEENYTLALKAVKRNQGAAGIDRMTPTELEPHLQANWWILKDKLLKGTYVPSPARRVAMAAEQSLLRCDPEAKRRHTDAGDTDGTGSPRRVMLVLFQLFLR
jgi:hypothetical protein